MGNNYKLQMMMAHYNHIQQDKKEMKRQTRSSKQKSHPKAQQKPRKKTGQKSKALSKTLSKSKSKNQKKQEIVQQMQQKQQKQKIDVTGMEYTVEKEGNVFKVKIHKNYSIDCQSQLGTNIQNLVTLLRRKECLKKSKVWDVTGFTFYPTFQFILAGQDPTHQKCSICQFQYESLSLQALQNQLTQEKDTDLVMLKCSHIMHFQCLRELVGANQWVKCPVCSSIYGKMIGDQPPGTMTHVVNKLVHCDGYLDCGTIIINYSMYAGSRGPIHFPGTHRSAYLPDNKQGNQVLALLKEAFKRKLIFTIGRSVTTGRDNQIVWNGIHHKTNTSGGSAYFGYPDPTYFQRVKLELAAKGVY